jgi:hypothetical protein
MAKWRRKTVEAWGYRVVRQSATRMKRVHEGRGTSDVGASEGWSGTYRNLPRIPRASPADNAEEKRISTFWMRRAAEQGHLYARRKPEENHIDPTELVPGGAGALTANVVLSTLYELKRIVF